MNTFQSEAPLLPAILSLHGKWRGGREAVICGDQRWSWARLCDANHAFAHGLIERGVAPGDRVVVLMSNGIPMLQALLGTMAAGAVSVPINLSVSDAALAGMIEDSGAVALVATADQAGRVRAIGDALPERLRLLVTDELAGPGMPDHGEPGGATPGRAWISIDTLCAAQPVDLPAVAIDGDSPLNIIYSSGTTGLPKGILHTHRGRRDWAYDLAIALRYHGSARTLLTIGLYSNISWVGMLCTLLAGGTLVIQRRFDASAFLHTVRTERITHTAMVPIQYQRVVEAMVEATVEAVPEGDADVSSMQSMMSCGSPLHQNLKQAIFERFPCGIIELYGLTEGIITTLEPEDAGGRWSSVGKPLLGTDICIVGDDDSVLGPGQVGEIVSRGRISMPGYWQREQASREAEFIGPDGVQWLRSGDLGYVDEEGFLYIVDRKKDMILSGGQNIYPQDIEAVLVQYPEVDDAAVIGLPSRRWGETPVALVVPVNGAPLDREALRDWVNDRVGRQQRLTDVIQVEALPRNPNGKILKRELRSDFGDRVYD